jgi:endonuclease/exonuclease/phosphatase family metal-dependent hydrolase
LWAGDNKHKGIGIFSVGANIQKLNCECDKLRLFLPVRVNEKFNLLGVWTKNSEIRQNRYIGQLWLYSQLHKSNISSKPIVICGDLNSNKIWDQKARVGNHTDVVDLLTELDIHSLYHLSTQQKQGKGLEPTFYLQKNSKKPYHIDYAFLSSVLIDSSHENLISIGKEKEWLKLSDHIPVQFFIKDF